MGIQHWRAVNRLPSGGSQFRGIIALAGAGKDPMARRRCGVKAPALTKRFLEECVPVRCEPGTREVYRSAIEIHVIPRPGNRRAADIERGDMVALHHALPAAPCRENRTLGVSSRMMNRAEAWDLHPDGSNPCRHVKRYREEKRERFLRGTGALASTTVAHNRGERGHAFRRIATRGRLHALAVRQYPC